MSCPGDAVNTPTHFAVRMVKRGPWIGAVAKIWRHRRAEVRWFSAKCATFLLQSMVDVDMYLILGSRRRWSRTLGRDADCPTGLQGMCVLPPQAHLH